MLGSCGCEIDVSAMVGNEMSSNSLFMVKTIWWRFAMLFSGGGSYGSYENR